jgi:HSP20 family molecular chaperone IbpA
VKEIKRFGGNIYRERERERAVALEQELEPERERERYRKGVIYTRIPRATASPFFFFFFG